MYLGCVCRDEFPFGFYAVLRYSHSKFLACVRLSGLGTGQKEKVFIFYSIGEK